MDYMAKFTWKPLVDGFSEFSRIISQNMNKSSSMCKNEICNDRKNEAIKVCQSENPTFNDIV
jgi:hypothetical protein